MFYCFLINKTKKMNDQIIKVNTVISDVGDNVDF
jgi:hypothetical protein